ncbi:hypothetical protein GCM10023189_03020 [Nibrella saemangeumensis]|uniref:PIN domain-containing protein n=1 Tax=Nibrella saemangeumensis TaxID=1084526 RepID=A0ABP8MDZ0_9BACT
MAVSTLPPELVADVNLIFSYLISGRKALIFEKIRIFVPDFALTELQKYEAVIKQKTRQTPYELKEFALALFTHITVVPTLLISSQSFYQAFMLCKGVDPNDTPYVALALELQLPLLTKDKQLSNGLQTNGFTNVITLEELLSLNDNLPDNPTV